MNSKRLEAIISDLPDEWTVQKGAMLESIEAFEHSMGAKLPEDYKEFLKRVNGGEGRVAGFYLMLWAVEDIAGMTRQYQIDKYLPTTLCIGSDGGTTGFGLRYKAGYSGEVDFVLLVLDDPDDNIILPMAPSFIQGMEELQRLDEHDFKKLQDSLSRRSR